MDLKLLREATRPEHEATEAAVPLTAPGLTVAGYVAVLARFHAVVGAWDQVAAECAPVAFTGLVKARRRSASLAADLLHFGEVPSGSPRPELLQEIADLTCRGDIPTRTARFLGAMYVLEGSTLGGRMIAAHVEDVLKLEPGQGDSFFRGYGERTMPMWREFQQALIAVPEGEGASVIDAAKGMFAIFRRWMR